MDELSEYIMEKRRPKTTTPGVRATGNRFQAFCLHDGKFKSIGYKDTQEEASQLRAEYMQANGLTRKAGRPRKSKP